MSVVTASESETFILFELAGTSYAVRSGSVQQVQMVEQITPVPNAIPVVEGVVYTRGRVIPALNLRVRFGFDRVPYDLRSRLIVVNVGGRVVGLLTDTAREFIQIPMSSIEAPPEAITGLSGKYLQGIASIKGRLILILNLEEVVDVGDPQAIVNQTERSEEA
jgi:purine-binding chemotaxis protein CheW